jgi:hypothetical protein
MFKKKAGSLLCQEPAMAKELYGSYLHELEIFMSAFSLIRQQHVPE